MEFKCSAGGKLISRNTYPDNFDSDIAVGETVVQWKSETASLQLDEKWFKGIHIVLIDIDPTAPEVFLLECSQAQTGFLFCLDGAIEYSLENQDYSPLRQSEQDLNLGSIDCLKFRVNETSQLLYVQLTEAYFKQIAGNVISNTPYTIQSIKPETNLILQHIINDRHEGRAKRLFLEARIFELIIVYLNQSEEKQVLTFKQEDINKIMLAKQLVEQDLQKPNSLIELSRKAGINDYKLKKGFKELTGHTVFGYLYKIRMEKAHYFLSEEKRTVNEVAFLVGYKNAQHFIAAFKKKYNILPGSLNKN
ncbi:helix-turn-helix domain-containing protein [Pedobacter sp. UBA5917]|jgi:AraC-like DNA-binding protein|uniref:helix-turn-helix domain-containing protein n=1 Tax=Pedobacter sp. UBA5917 TaxID=1947061 RepID=UPI0026013F45|nr:AraC family transcriptional regulator [Pedobacter sp. UBA5917]